VLDLEIRYVTTILATLVPSTLHTDIRYIHPTDHRKSTIWKFI